jgi:hypothetical protein
MGRRTFRSGRSKKQTGRLRILIVAVIVGVALDLTLWFGSGTGDWRRFGLSLAVELIGAVVTYGLLVRWVEGRREEEEEEDATDVIERLGSNVNAVALAAADNLRQRGWLRDGALREAKLLMANLRGANLRDANLEGVNLWGADLQGADLWGADLQRANLLLANLQGARLRFANLQGANLWGADLQGTNLLQSNLQGARLSEAWFNESTVMPDGTAWTPYLDIAQFTNPEHDGFWRSESPSSPAYWRDREEYGPD